jgi:hypothetical protein
MSTLWPKNPGSNTTVYSAFTEVKTLKTTASHPYDTFPCLPGARVVADLWIFREKNRPRIPVTGPPYFRTIDAFPAFLVLCTTSSSSLFSR